MKCSRSVFGACLFLALLLPASLIAQEDAAPQVSAAPEEPADEVAQADSSADADDEESEAGDEGETPDEAVESPADEPQSAPSQEAPELVREPAPSSDVGEDEGDWPDEDFDDFDALSEDIEFVPAEAIDDAMLDRLTPLSSFPYVELSGYLRARSRARVGFDLGTGGTSAVLPPLETVSPAGGPADPEARNLWTSDLRLRLAPTFHISETLRVHTEADLLDNIALGADPRHSYFVEGMPGADRRVLGGSNSDAQLVRVRQAYGEVDAFFGTLSAGRMLNHWGLGLFANSGQCDDCDFGDQVDRVSLRTSAFGFNVLAAYDFGGAGLTSDELGYGHGTPHELSRLDGTHQWTAQVWRSPISRADRERQSHALATTRRPVFNGGLYVTGRHNRGQALVDEAGLSTEAPPELYYRGLDIYSADLWGQMLWEPAEDRRIRLEIEALGTFGSVDNTTSAAVGFDADSGLNVNCFNEGDRETNPGACTNDADGNVTSKSVSQFGLAFESEFYFGGPVSFGINAGLASGGDSPNWGYGDSAANQLDFMRFSPDYHVDLILFREVMGT